MAGKRPVLFAGLRNTASVRGPPGSCQERLDDETVELVGRFDGHLRLAAQIDRGHAFPDAGSRGGAPLVERFEFAGAKRKPAGAIAEDFFGEPRAIGADHVLTWHGFGPLQWC